MLKRKILVTGIGGDIGQSIIKCLRDSNYQLHIVGSDIDPYAAAKEEVNEFYQSPWAREVSLYKTFIDNILEKEQIDYIIPVTEPEISFFHQHRMDFSNTTQVLINLPYIIDTFFDKYKTVQFLKDNDLLCPRTYPIKEYTNQLDFPVVLKQRHGYGSKGLYILHNMEELDIFRKRSEDTLVQEIIGSSNDEYTVGVFSDGKSVHSMAFQRYLGYGSLSKVARLVNDSQISSLAEQVARRARLYGSFNIQMRKTDKSYVILEINPRFSSTVYIRHYFGFRDVWWWLDLFEGQPIEYIPKYTRGTGVRRLSEVFFDCQQT